MAPFLAAVAAFALATGGFLAALLAFLIFASVMGSLMLAVSLLVSASQDRLLRGLRASARSIQRAGAGVMVVVGAGLIYFSVATGTFRRIFFPG